MKRILNTGAFLLLIGVAACNSNNAENTTDDSSPDSPATQYRGVENVNGNIPDTATHGSEPSANYHTDSAR